LEREREGEGEGASHINPLFLFLLSLFTKSYVVELLISKLLTLDPRGHLPFCEENKT